MYTPIHVYIYIYVCIYGAYAHICGVWVFLHLYGLAVISLYPPPLAKVLWEILNPRYDLILK